MFRVGIREGVSNRRLWRWNEVTVIVSRYVRSARRWPNESAKGNASQYEKKERRRKPISSGRLSNTDPAAYMRRFSENNFKGPPNGGKLFLSRLFFTHTHRCQPSIYRGRRISELQADSLKMILWRNVESFYNLLAYVTNLS